MTKYIKEPDSSQEGLGIRIEEAVREQMEQAEIAEITARNQQMQM